MTLMTQSAYAKHRGVTAPLISRWVKEARIILVDGKVDVDASDKVLDAVLQKHRKPTAEAKAAQSAKMKENHRSRGAPMKQVAPSAESVTTYADARVQRETYAAKREKLAYELAVGKVCETDKVIKAILDNAAATRRALERLPDRLASRMAAEPDERKCRMMLVAEVAEVCREVAKIAENLPQQFQSTEH